MNKELLVYKPKFSRSFYEVKDGTEVIGSVNITKMFGTLAEAVIADKHWTFKRNGFWKPYISIRKAGAETDLIQVPISGSFGGSLILNLPGQNSFELRQTGFWNPKRIWVSGNKPLMEFDRLGGMKKYAKVKVFEPGPEFPLLLMLGVYGLIMQDWDDSAAGTVVVVG